MRETIARWPILTGILAAICVLAMTLTLGWWQIDGPGAPEPASTSALPDAIGEMEFDLVNHRGQPVGPGTLAGKAAMVFFGFTHCPDVCPTTLADISGWLDALGEEAEDLNVVFITVDPERDTPRAMREYIGYFHPAVRGWTGSVKGVNAALAGFKAKAERVPLKGENYTMNHSSGVYLFNAGGQFRTIIDYHEPRDFALPKIQRIIE